MWSDIMKTTLIWAFGQLALTAQLVYVNNYQYLATTTKVFAL